MVRSKFGRTTSLAGHHGVSCEIIQDQDQAAISLSQEVRLSPESLFLSNELINPIFNDRSSQPFRRPARPRRAARDVSHACRYLDALSVQGRLEVLTAPGATARVWAVA